MGSVGLGHLNSYGVRRDLGVWETRAKKHQSLWWMGMRRAEEGLDRGLCVDLVLVLGKVEGRGLSAALNSGQQTHRRG